MTVNTMRKLLDEHHDKPPVGWIAVYAERVIKEFKEARDNV